MGNDNYVNYQQLVAARESITTRFNDMLDTMQEIKGKIQTMLSQSYGGSSADAFEETYARIEQAINAEREKFNQEIEMKLTEWKNAFIAQWEQINYNGS